MTRKRPATERVYMLGRGAVKEALDASLAAGSIKAFCKVVGMRNPSRSYFVRHQGRLHSLKAIVAFALRQDNPNTLARHFHAVDAARHLRALKFNVVHGVDAKEEERERVWIERLGRPGQRAFRQMLIEIYGGCPLSGCTTLAVLEAAHVDEVSSKGKDSSDNGVLLRADLHKLFDFNLLAIDPNNGRLSLVADCAADYGELLEGYIFTPQKGGPSLERFRNRWAEHLKLKTHERPMC